MFSVSSNQDLLVANPTTCDTMKGAGVETVKEVTVRNTDHYIYNNISVLN